MESKVNLIGNAAILKDLINYQEGSTVSREIIKKETGTVTLFAFDKGQGLSEHTAPFDALVQVLDGIVDIVIAGTKHTLKAGEILVMGSYPGYDPNALTETWETLSQDARAPLLNRAVQGAYKPGAALGPLLYEAAVDLRAVPAFPAELAFTFDDGQLACARPPEKQAWPEALQAAGAISLQ